MIQKKIHIVSFDVVYPPNYGGVIDVFYKIKALHAIGVAITLHMFEYGRGEQKELEKYCDKVFYYKRKIAKRALFSRTPFIVKSRSNILLEKRLVSDQIPVLFEGLHTTELVSKSKLTFKTTMVRTHNIEHRYYDGLSKNEANVLKKIFFKSEGIKLKKYESVLKKTDYIFTISLEEQEYFTRLYGSKVLYLPVFTNTDFTDLLPEENFILWHGDLRVNDNVKSVLKAIDLVKNTLHKLVIATSFKNNVVVNACKPYNNITIDPLGHKNDLEILLRKAKVNLLFTFQPTGIKLKLMNTLIKSRYVLTNKTMVEGTGLKSLCKVCSSDTEVLDQLNLLMNSSFSVEKREERKKALESFKSEKNAQLIKDLL